MTKVDILIPTYNVEETIEQSLSTVLNQDGVDYNIFILDDCSTDDTLSKVESFFNSRSFKGKLSIEKNEKNQGIGLNRNRLIEMAESELCCWFDADDYMLPNKLIKQVDYFNKNPSCNFLATEMFAKFSNSSCVIEFPNKSFIVNNLTLEKIKTSNCINNPTVMFRPERVVELGGYKDMRAEEDWDLWRRVYENGGVINSLPHKLLLYTLPEGWPNHHAHGKGGS
jgi:glycosyltransferase involved in cell wall biosynthesis